MTNREWKKRIYRGMATELQHQAFSLGAAWLTLDGDGEPLPEAEMNRMTAAATEIIDRFCLLGGPSPGHLPQEKGSEHKIMRGSG